MKDPTYETSYLIRCKKCGEDTKIVLLDPMKKQPENEYNLINFVIENKDKSLIKVCVKCKIHTINEIIAVHF